MGIPSDIRLIPITQYFIALWLFAAYMKCSPPRESEMLIPTVHSRLIKKFQFFNDYETESTPFHEDCQVAGSGSGLRDCTNRNP